MSEEKIISLEEFLVNVAPGKRKTTTLFTIQNSYTPFYSIRISKLNLYCPEETCKGIRFYESTNEVSAVIDKERHFLLTFRCNNCSKSVKLYSLLLKLLKPNLCEVYKIGELPEFGPSIPSKMFKLIGENKDLFFIGRRAENQGMGIGAFAYYRRVVENQKNKIFDEIIKALKTNKSSEKLVEELSNAKKQTQFTSAIDSIKSALPDILLISGHNPLTLLHKALSEGIHSNSDEECLELATSIRVILTELSERITHILKEQKELDIAVSKLLNRKK